jgi:ABC-type long-subunit fatty acid transport system fused permease/ATPase subunit
MRIAYCRTENVVNTPLINPEKVYLPPLHIILGLIKNVIKAMDQNSTGFMYLKNKFPTISDAKIKEGVFVGPQVRELIRT